MEVRGNELLTVKLLTIEEMPVVSYLSFSFSQYDFQLKVWPKVKAIKKRSSIMGILTVHKHACPCLLK